MCHWMQQENAFLSFFHTNYGSPSLRTKGDRARIVEVKERGAIIRQQSEVFVMCGCVHNTCTYTGVFTIEVGSPFEYLKRD